MKRLHYKLSAAMFVIVLLLGAAFYSIDRYSVRLYYEELSQRLNSSLAMYVVNAGALIRNGEVDRAALSELASRAMIINPTADLNLDTNYAIQISADAVVDLAANPFAGILAPDVTTWNFATIAETIPPTLVSTSPVDDASGVAVNSNLVATFDETVTVGTGNITIKNLTEATDTVIPVGDAQVSVSGMDLTIDLSTDLDPGDDTAVFRPRPGRIEEGFEPAQLLTLARIAF